MKKLFLLLIAGFLISGNANAQSLERVGGYYRQSGTYVQPYVRTTPDSNPYNNYGGYYNGH